MNEATAPVLTVRDLQTHFHVGSGLLKGEGDVVKAIDGVSFDIKEGEIFGLVGESGSGKTTLGRTILGLVPATSGSIMWRGQELAGMRERHMRPLRRKLGMIFQDPNASLNPAMTIAQGVGHPLRIHGITSNRADTRAKVHAMLERCGLTPAERYMDVYPEDISGGQKQRVVIARTLITEPDFVVADEPVAALDMSIRAKVLELMIDLKDELGLTYLYITHDLSSSRFVCDRMAIMYLGKMVEWGDAKAIYDNPQHPYTQSLIGAIPLPDPSRRGRDKQLPRGEIPDAQHPPKGCSFHPRCPKAFEVCGWEGRDLIDALEDRWTMTDAATFERELGLTGPIHKAATETDRIRFKTDNPAELSKLLTNLGPQLATPVMSAVVGMSEDGGDLVVEFGPGPAPMDQLVANRTVACHLHGATPNG